MDTIIKNKDLEVTVSSLGAQMVSVKYCNKERLWQNDNGSWSKHAPILFPHAGACSIVVNGVHYPDQFHGFARDLEFTLIDSKADEVTYLLTECEYSKKTYPFDFKFYVTYKIDGNQLTIKQRFVNPSNDDIYFFIGAHESYKVDNDIANYYVEFDKNEVFDSIELPSFKSINIGKGKIITLDSSLLDNSSTIILHNINSRKVTLKRRDDDKVVAITTFDDFPNLLLWHSEGSKMICIEPWMNLPDDECDKEKELKDKEHVIKLSKGEEKTLIRTIEYFDNK